MATPDDYGRCLAGTRNVQTLAGMMAREGVDVAVGSWTTQSGVAFVVIVAQGDYSESVGDVGRYASQVIEDARQSARDEAAKG